MPTYLHPHLSLSLSLSPSHPPLSVLFHPRWCNGSSCSPQQSGDSHHYHWLSEWSLHLHALLSEISTAPIVTVQWSKQQENIKQLSCSLLVTLCNGILCCCMLKRLNFMLVTEMHNMHMTLYHSDSVNKSLVHVHRHNLVLHATKM